MKTKDLQKENDDLRQINEFLVDALMMVAGLKQCVDGLLSNAEIAQKALKTLGEPPK